MNLTISFSQLLEQVKTMDRAILVAIAVSFMVVVYSGNLGWQWWNNNQLANDLRIEADELRTAARNAALDEAFPDDTLERQIEELAEIASTFSFATEDELLGMIDGIAREDRLAVINMSTRDGGTETRGTMTFRARTGSITVEGQAQRIYQYLDDLSAAAPGLTIDSVSISGLDKTPRASITVRFLINPEPTGGAG